jgi:hypothetical protein
LSTGMASARPVSDEEAFANPVRTLIPDFELIRDTANASKHLQIQKGQLPASPMSASNTYVMSTGLAVAALVMARTEGPRACDSRVSTIRKSR